MDFIFFLITCALAWPVTHYWIVYTGWKHPEYHQDDKIKLIVWSVLMSFSLVATLIAMVKS